VPSPGCDLRRAGWSYFSTECADCVDMFRGRGCLRSSAPMSPRMLRATCAEMHEFTGSLARLPWSQPFVQKDCWTGLAARHSASKLEATMPIVQRVQTCPAVDPSTCRSAPTQLFAGDCLPCKTMMYRLCSYRSQVHAPCVPSPPGTIAYVHMHRWPRAGAQQWPPHRGWAPGL